MGERKGKRSKTGRVVFCNCPSLPSGGIGGKRKGNQPIQLSIAGRKKGRKKGRLRKRSQLV